MEQAVSSNVKEQIRSRLDIAEVISEVVALQAAGNGRFRGLCPFHAEKTPSFHVLTDKGFYYCFGCHAKGDIFDFVTETQGISFSEALMFLGQRAGVEVKPQSTKDKKQTDLYAVNTLALKYFKSNLKGEALSYLQNRKLLEKTIEEFELGYAPNSWDSLLKLASAQGIRQEELLTSGLVSQSQQGKIYDRFRNRVMFPIKDSIGRVVGFSGRVLDNSLPKYLNSPETPIFKKAQLLYGLDKAKYKIRDSSACIIVEGYMDAIALHQTGFTNTVAALGASVTKEQALQLARLEVKHLYLAFDADEAGQRAIIAGLEQFVGNQFLVKAVNVPFGKDPAETVLEGHIDAFKKALKQGLSEVTFRFDNVVKKHDKNSVSGKKAILEELLPALKPRDIFDPVSSELRRLVTEHLELNTESFEAWLKTKHNKRLNDIQVKGLSNESNHHAKVVLIELSIMSLLFLEPDRLSERLPSIEAALPPENYASLLSEFCVICHEKNFDSRKILLAYKYREEASYLFKKLFDNNLVENIDIDTNLQKDLARLRQLYLSSKTDDYTKLLERRQEISSQLTDPNLPTDALQQYYSELKRINDTLKAREAEKRLRVVSKKPYQKSN